MTTISTPRRVDIDDAHAGFASRAIAFVLDLLLVAIAILGADLFVRLIGSFFPIGRLFAQLTGIQPGGEYRSQVALAVTVVAFIAYNTFWWTMIGETPGKAVLGLRVVRTNGERLRVGRAFVRSLAYWISALPLFLGFLWILVDDKRQGWHDKIAGTCVIYARQEQIAKQPARRAAQASS